jgi:SSS family solute:Na+ symporter
VILIFGSIMITWFAYEAAGGWEPVRAITPDSHFNVLKSVNDDTLPWPAVFTGVFLIGFYFWGTNQYITQRTLASRSVLHGQWGAMFAGLLKVGILFIMIFPGAFARVLYPELENNVDMIYPTMLFDLLPTGMLGLVLAGLIAAMMSSLDSGLNSVSTLFTMDFYTKANPEADTRKLMKVGRICTFTIMIIAILWAPQIGKFEKLWDYLQNTLAWFCPPIVALFVVGLFSKRVNNFGAMAGIFVGGSITLFLILAQAFSWEAGLPHFLYMAFIHFMICIATMFLVSHYYGSMTAANTDGMVWTKAEFDHMQSELKKLPWWQNYQLHGLILLLIIVVILIMY